MISTIFYSIAVDRSNIFMKRRIANMSDNAKLILMISNAAMMQEEMDTQ